MKRLLIILSLLAGPHGFAAADCPPSTTVFLCEKILSSEVKGRPEDKVVSARYRIWLEGDEGKKQMRIDGSASWQATDGNGSLAESKFPQSSRPIGMLSGQKLEVKECEWRLTQTFAQQVLRTYPNFPKAHDRYRVDLKNSELSVSMPIGIKSFAFFKLSCSKEAK